MGGDDVKSRRNLINILNRNGLKAQDYVR
jgi:hypothetical protein